MSGIRRKCLNLSSLSFKIVSFQKIDISKRTAILAIKNHKEADQPPSKAAVLSLDGKIIDVKVNHDSDISFIKSCSVSWRNRLHIFGGEGNKRLIASLVGCKISKIGTLSQVSFIQWLEF